VSIRDCGQIASGEITGCRAILPGNHVGFQRERLGMAGIERRLVPKNQFADAAGIWQLAGIVPDYALIARRTLQPMEEGFGGKIKPAGRLRHDLPDLFVDTGKGP